jgi:hypothetical protein
MNNYRFECDLGPSPEEIRYHKVMRLIVAEFQSDPMSTQCFDKRIVDDAIKLVDEYEKRHARYFRKFGRGDEEAVNV